MVSSSALPPCGIYVTRSPIGSIPAGRLVYFHNHGNPGPGLYLPSSWTGNRATFQARGQVLANLARVDDLDPLLAEGFYRVVQPFDCCAKRCRTFEAERLVQLGYDGAGNAILFLPRWVRGALVLPERGTRVDRDRLGSLSRLEVAVEDSRLHEGEVDEIFLH